MKYFFWVQVAPVLRDEQSENEIIDVMHAANGKLISYVPTFLVMF